MCDKFEDNRRAVSRPQQVLRMVDGNNTNCLPDGLYRWTGRYSQLQLHIEKEVRKKTYSTVQHSLIIWLHCGIVIQDQNLSFEPSHR